MKIEPVTLAHKDYLRAALKDTGAPFSEYTFASLYLFRNKHNYRVIFDEENFITGSTYDGHDFLMPLKHISRYDPAYLRGMMKKFGMLFPVAEEWLPSLTGGVYHTSYNDDDSDYIFTIEKMGTYKGKKLHGKRNLLKQFMESYKSEALPLTNDRLGDAIAVLEAWQEESATDVAATDYHECREALEFYEELVLCGGMYYADGEPAGFIIGEDINESMFTLHLAKGKRKFKGLYQYMFNNFAQVMPAKYCLLNLEQDMGIDSLRQAKASYYPDKLLKKFRVSLGE